MKKIIIISSLLMCLTSNLAFSNEKFSLSQPEKYKGFVMPDSDNRNNLTVYNNSEDSTMIVEYLFCPTDQNCNEKKSVTIPNAKIAQNYVHILRVYGITKVTKINTTSQVTVYFDDPNRFYCGDWRNYESFSRDVILDDIKGTDTVTCTRTRSSSPSQ
jgi:hypothetical protein